MLQEALYKDFFEPPPRVPKQKSKKVTSPTKAGRVRFHEEVRVRNIKANGKNLPLNTPDNEEDDEEVGEDIDGSEDNELLLEQLLSDGTLEASGSGAEDSNSEEENGRETIGRLKDDLFADEDQEQDHGTFIH